MLPYMYRQDVYGNIVKIFKFSRGESWKCLKGQNEANSSILSKILIGRNFPERAFFRSRFYIILHSAHD